MRFLALLKLFSIMFFFFILAFGSASFAGNSQSGRKQLTELNAQLLKAAELGNLDQLEALLAQGADINARNWVEMTPLHWAASKGYDYVVEKLLQNPRVSVNAADYWGITALHMAVKKGNARVIEILLRAPGIDVNMADREGNTALKLAILSDNANAIEKLLQIPGVNVSAKDILKKTALHWAAIKGNAHAVTRLLQAPGVNVNEKDSMKWTPLHEAARGGHAHVIEVLLQAPGANINARGYLEKTALHEAAERGHAHVVKTLLQAPGSWPQNKGSFSLILFAFLQGKIYLKNNPSFGLSWGINVNSKYWSGETALHFAAERGHAHVVETLLQDPRVDVNERDVFAMTALHFAAKRGHANVVEKLLQDPRVDIHARHRFNLTAFESALRSSNTNQETLAMLVPEVRIFFLTQKDSKRAAFRIRRHQYDMLTQALIELNELYGQDFIINFFVSAGEMPLNKSNTKMIVSKYLRPLFEHLKAIYESSFVDNTSLAHRSNEERFADLVNRINKSRSQNSIWDDSQP
jgi:ankyrin repeat protein